MYGGDCPSYMSYIRGVVRRLSVSSIYNCSLNFYHAVNNSPRFFLKPMKGACSLFQSAAVSMSRSPNGSTFKIHSFFFHSTTLWNNLTTVSSRKLSSLLDTRFLSSPSYPTRKQWSYASQTKRGGVRPKHSEYVKAKFRLNTSLRDKALIILKNIIIINSRRNICALYAFSRLLREEKFQIPAQGSYCCRELTLICNCWKCAGLKN